MDILESLVIQESKVIQDILGRVDTAEYLAILGLKDYRVTLAIRVSLGNLDILESLVFPDTQVLREFPVIQEYLGKVGTLVFQGTLESKD